MCRFSPISTGKLSPIGHKYIYTFFTIKLNAFCINTFLVWHKIVNFSQITLARFYQITRLPIHIFTKCIFFQNCIVKIEVRLFWVVAFRQIPYSWLLFLFITSIYILFLIQNDHKKKNLKNSKVSRWKYKLLI